MNPTSPEDLDMGRFQRALGQTFSSLKTRNFRLFFFGQLISNSGNWLTNVAMTLLVLKITHSGLAVGLLAAFQFGPILFLSAWAGAVADRVDKRKFLFMTQTLEMAQSASLAVLAFMPHPPLAGLYILATFGGIFLAFDNPLRRSFVSEMVDAKDTPNAVVLYSTIVNSSRIFGPAIAGLLIVNFGYGWCFVLDSASYLAVLFSLQRMRVSELHRVPPKARKKGEIRAGLHYILSEPMLWITFVMLAAIGTISYNFNVTLPLFVTDALHKSSTVFTILYSVFSLGAVITSLIIANRRLVGLKHIIFGAAALGVSMLGFALVPNLSFAVPLIFLVGASSILYMTASTALVQLQAKSEVRGRVLALQTVLLIGTTPIGSPFLGWLADKYGGRSPIILGGVAALITAGFGYYAARKFLHKAPLKPETA